MIQDRKSKKGAAAGLIFAAVVLVLVVLLENLSSLLPSVPAVLQHFGAHVLSFAIYKSNLAVIFINTLNLQADCALA